MNKTDLVGSWREAEGYIDDEPKEPRYEHVMVLSIP